MSRNNIKMLDRDIPAYQLAKRARLDQLAHEAQREDQGGIVVVGIVVLLILGTGIALLVAHQVGWW